MSTLIEHATPRDLGVELGLSAAQIAALKATSMYVPYLGCEKAGEIGRRTRTLQVLKRQGFLDWVPQRGCFRINDAGRKALDAITAAERGDLN